MQGGRGGGNPFFNFGDPFAGFGGFGGFGGQQSNMLSGFMGGRDPFDDPFFTRPFESMFGQSMLGQSMLGQSMFGPSIFGSAGSPFQNRPSQFIENHAPFPNRSTGPIIEEINSDEEKEDTKEKKGNPRKHGRQNIEPYVEDPDDETEARRKKYMLRMNEHDRMNNYQAQPQAHGFTFQSSSVTYGGPNGAYYTSSRTKRAGSDGVMIDESKEADTTTGEATHKISRGIHHKGHSTMRKLNADGKVDTMQTLHNLNEDELAGFEEAWKGNADIHLPGRNARLNHQENIGIGSSRSRGRNVEANERVWALPSTTPSERTVKNKNGDSTGSSRVPKPDWKQASIQKF